jgi:pimeloyl-ACP methyl ester carboxylesterase
VALTRTWPEVEDGVAEGRPDIPTLFVHGGNDPVVPIEVSRELAARLPQATLHEVPGDLHDVLNEHDREAVHEVVAAFVAAQVRRAAVPA